MTTELYYLTLACLLTAIQWAPHIFNQVIVRGLRRAMGNPQPDDVPLLPWAQRSKSAHSNSIENLVPFGLLVLVAHLAGVNSDATATAAAVYFVSRLAHYFAFVIGVPYIRTVIFIIGWSAILVFGFEIIDGRS